VELKGSVAVVTGASAGIGWATAAAFAREGARVVVAARREERLNELVQEIGNRGGMAVPVVCDVGDWAQVQALAERTRQEFGRCDVLVNNAGVPGGGWFADMSMEKAEQVTRINYLGVLYGTKAFLPMMLEAGRGHVVNVASLAGRFAVPGSAVYSASKHAVVAFSESLNSTMKPHGILVTAGESWAGCNGGLPPQQRHSEGPKGVEARGRCEGDRSRRGEGDRAGAFDPAVARRHASVSSPYASALQVRHGSSCQARATCNSGR
jgi:NADP-dependent 3-hydroxy acid dehydrogenase YdfG